MGLYYLWEGLLLWYIVHYITPPIAFNFVTAIIIFRICFSELIQFSV